MLKIKVSNRFFSISLKFVIRQLILYKNNNLVFLLDKVYCESCWLFADRKHSYFKSNWINGIDDWQHLTLKINKHESSIQHIEAVKLRTIWTKNLTIDQSIEILISKEAQK